MPDLDITEGLEKDITGFLDDTVEDVVSTLGDTSEPDTPDEPAAEEVTEDDTETEVTEDEPTPEPEVAETVEEDGTEDAPTLDTDSAVADVAAAAPEPAAEPEPEPVVDEAPTSALNTFLGDIEGDDRDAAENHIVEMIQWEQTLPANAGELFQAVLSDDYVLVPRAQFEASQQAPAAQPEPEVDTTEYADPELAERIARIEAAQGIGQDPAAPQAPQDPIMQAQAQGAAEYQSNQFRAQIDAGMTQFGQAHGLAGSDVEQLAKEVGQSGLLPSYVQAHNGDNIAGLNAALEAAFWQNPTYRQAEAAREVEVERQAAEQSRATKRKASSLSGSPSGSPTQVDPNPEPSDDLEAAFAAQEWSTTRKNR